MEANHPDAKPAPCLSTGLSGGLCGAAGHLIAVRFQSPLNSPRRTREVDADGFTTKNRDWNNVEVLERWREAWARDSNAALERAGIEDRVDHRTLVAQRDEALELASAARERGDEGAELHETVRAMSLDRPPLPQLSLGAWQLKERGIEVAAVRVWHEVRQVRDRSAIGWPVPLSASWAVWDQGNPSWRLLGAVTAERKSLTLPRGCVTHGRRDRAVKRNRVSMRRSGMHRRFRRIWRHDCAKRRRGSCRML